MLVGALMRERSRSLLTDPHLDVTPDWLAIATHLFLALDVFKFGHLDLDGAPPFGFSSCPAVTRLDCAPPRACVSLLHPLPCQV